MIKSTNFNKKKFSLRHSNSKFKHLYEYLFVLGRDKELSLLELKSYFKNFKIKKQEGNLLIVQLPKMNFTKVINDLGGVLKIAEVFDWELLFSKNKINYGVNYYYGDFDLDFLKKQFKSEKFKAVHKFSKTKEITPSDSLKLDLELIVFGKVYKVISVYNPKKYKLRDETREYYDALKVTSLRLAKIMINLSSCNGVLVDPFCGLGTILQESCLMGLKCVGLEKDLGTVTKCRKNLSKYKGWKVVHGDACKIDKYFSKIDCVVSEPYLGPYLKKIPKYDDAKNVAKKLRVMYSDFLRGLSKLVIGRVVLIVPVFKTDKARISIGFDKMLEKYNFKVLKGFPYKYAPKGCKIERMIYVFEK